MQTVKSSYGKGVHLVAPSSRKQYLLTCPPCKTYNVFDLCHHALAASGIVMEYLMEVVKKFEKKKNSSYLFTKHTSQHWQLVNWEWRRMKSVSLILKDLRKMTVVLWKHLVQPEVLKLRKITIPEHPCQTVQNLGQKSSPLSQNLPMKNSQIPGYQTSFQGNKTSTTLFISSLSHSLMSPYSTNTFYILFAQAFFNQHNLVQFNQHRQPFIPLIFPSCHNDLFPYTLTTFTPNKKKLS